MKRFFALLLLLFPLWPVLSVSARESFASKHVLVVCSHDGSSEWAQDMLLPVRELEASRGDIEFYTVFLRITSLSSPEELDARMEEVFSVYDDGEGPQLVILVGGGCYTLAPDVNRRWPDVPILLTGENDYYCNKQYVLEGRPDPDAERKPVSSFLEDGINLSLLYAPVMVEQTVDLMTRLIPDMDKLLFIAGENFQCREQQVRLERYLTALHSHISYVPVYASEYPTDELILMLQEQDPATTGVLFGSWLMHRGYTQTVSSRQNVTHVIEAIMPVFTLFGTDFEKNHLIAGYDSYDHQRYYRDFRERILQVLDEGKAPRDIPFLRFISDRPTVNWFAMQNFGMDTSLIPDDAYVYGKPQSLWSAYGRVILFIIFAAVILILLTMFIMMRHSLRVQERARKAAVEANDMKTLFVQNMSHEIRTPMNAIIGFAQLLGLPDGVNTEEEKAEYLSYVMNNSHLLSMLIGDILSLSDMENGNYKLNIAPCNLNEMCRLAVRSVEHRAQPGVEMIFTTRLPEKARVLTDGMRVQQLLINYLTNACKHTMEGSIRLHCSLDENPGQVTFSVTDTGTGVPPEQAENIFHRFVKLNAHAQGTGLGLHICSLIAKGLEGTVYLDTTYTGGARFVFTIPMRMATENPGTGVGAGHYTKSTENV